MPFNLKPKPLVGLFIAGTIIAFWIGSLEFSLRLPIGHLSRLWILVIILGRTFIHTGLFIVAHDAIHRAVVPNNNHLNDLIGQLSVTLYAFLSYRKLSLNHWLHHRYPGQLGDPDFHNSVYPNVFAWYVKFMKGYLDAQQRWVLLGGIGLTFLTLDLGFQVPIANLCLFWVLPIILSSIQLFVFGTYLPHRSCCVNGMHINGVENLHHATSSNYSIILSFLTCYHFGYHWEHHEYPSLPWYGLPAARQIKRYKPLNEQTDIGQPLIMN